MKKILMVFGLTALLASAAKADDVSQHDYAEDQSYTVQDVDFDADLFPSQVEGKYGVIILNGSGGGKANGWAKKIADMGYSVLSLAYFDRNSDRGIVPKSLEMIQLEYFDAPKKWLMQRSETRNDGVVVVGASKGAELALVLGSYDSDYKGVVGVAPSSVIWQGIPEDTSKITDAPSTWSKNGKGLPFVRYLPRDVVKRSGLTDMLFWHSSSMVVDENIEDKLIKVESIDAPILLLTGEDDMVWPSNQMASFLCKRANEEKVDKLCTHVNYPHASHLLGDGEDLEAGFVEIRRFIHAVNE